jgi:hypothetical protein
MPLCEQRLQITAVRFTGVSTVPRLQADNHHLHDTAPTESAMECANSCPLRIRRGEQNLCRALGRIDSPSSKPGPGSAACQLCDLGQATKPLCASISLPIK